MQKWSAMLQAAARQFAGQQKAAVVQLQRFRHATPMKRARIPGPTRAAGSKLLRMAAERRIGKAHP